MRNVPLYGSRPTVLALPATTDVLANASPFSALNKVKILSPAAATLYGVNRATDIARAITVPTETGVLNSRYKYLRIIADGVATSWAAANYPELNNGHNDAGALTAANRLRTCVVANGVILQRKQSDVALTGGDFRLVASGTTLEAQKAGGGAFGAGTVLEVFMHEASEIVTQGPTVGGVMQEVTCYDFMHATTAAALFAEL
jgi:hypothetical protein